MLDSDYGSHPPLGPATPFLKRGSSRRDDKMLTLADLWKAIDDYTTDNPNDDSIVAVFINDEYAGVAMGLGRTVNNELSFAVSNLDEHSQGYKKRTFSQVLSEMKERWPRKGGVVRVCGRTYRVRPDANMIVGKADTPYSHIPVQGITSVSLETREVDGEPAVAFIFS